MADRPSDGRGHAPPDHGNSRPLRCLGEWRRSACLMSPLSMQHFRLLPPSPRAAGSWCPNSPVGTFLRRPHSVRFTEMDTVLRPEASSVASAPSSAWEQGGLRSLTGKPAISREHGFGAENTPVCCCGMATRCRQESLLGGDCKSTDGYQSTQVLGCQQPGSTCCALYVGQSGSCHFPPSDYLLHQGKLVRQGRNDVA